jgi:flagellar biosynthesis protein FlhF
MPTRIYRASDIREALNQIKQDMGPDAYIVHQRPLRRSGWWPFGRKEWEIVASAPGGDRVPSPPVQDAGGSALVAEVSELRATLSRLMRAADLARLPESSETLTACFDTLCRKGVSPDLAQEVVLAARDELSPTAQHQEEAVYAAVCRHLEKRIRTRPLQPVRGSGPLVVFLLGQAGVGKTTTLVKLATRQFLEGRRVCLINADLERATAGVQIEVFGKALNMDVETVSGADAFREALARHEDKQVIFVDTPGYSHRDGERIGKLASLTCLAHRRQSFLVIPCTTSLDEMSEIVRGFRPVGLDGLIFSKIDETESLGIAVTLACQSDVPVAYLTTGRRIPEDIEPVTATRLSTLLLNGIAPSPRETLLAGQKRGHVGRPAPDAQRDELPFPEASAALEKRGNGKEPRPDIQMNVSPMQKNSPNTEQGNNGSKPMPTSLPVAEDSAPAPANGKARGQALVWHAGRRAYHISRLAK